MDQATRTPLNGQYWCHGCQSRTKPYLTGEDQELCCSTCHSTFVEQLEDDGSLYQQQQQEDDSLLDSAMDSILMDPISSSTTTSSSQQQQQQQIPRASPNLHPFLQSFFNNASTNNNRQQQQQQVPDVSVVINDLINNFLNPTANTNTASPNRAQNVFSFNLSDMFNGMGMGGDGLRMGDYFLGDNLEALINQLIDHNGRVGTPPASKRAMESLPIVQASEQHCEKECTICQEHYKTGEEIVEMPCKHVFHKECLWPWLLRHSTCPTCRFQLENTDASPNPDSVSDHNRPTTSNGNNGSSSQFTPPPRFNLQNLFNFNPMNQGNNRNNNNNNNNQGSGGGGNMSYFL